MFTYARAAAAAAPILDATWHASLFGWVGATDRALSKYADLLGRLGARDSVRTVAPTLDAFARPARIRALAEAWLADVERRAPGRPCVALLASNGGAFVYADAVAALAADAARPAHARRFAHVSVRAIIFDSAPAWVTPHTAARAFSEGRAAPAARAAAYAAARCVFTLAAPLLAARAAPFFETLRADASAAPALYVYSERDVVTDAARLRAHVAARREAHPGGPGSVLELVTDAAHCAHLREQPRAYEDAIAGLLRLARARHEAGT